MIRREARYIFSAARITLSFHLDRAEASWLQARGEVYLRVGHLLRKVVDLALVPGFDLDAELTAPLVGIYGGSEHAERARAHQTVDLAAQGCCPPPRPDSVPQALQRLCVVEVAVDEAVGDAGLVQRAAHTLAPTMPTAAMSVPVQTTTGTSHSSAVSTTLVP